MVRPMIDEARQTASFRDEGNGLVAVVPLPVWKQAWEYLEVAPGAWEWADRANGTVVTVDTFLPPKGAVVSVRRISTDG